MDDQRWIAIDVRIFFIFFFYVVSRLRHALALTSGAISDDANSRKLSTTSVDLVRT